MLDLVSIRDGQQEFRVGTITTRFIWVVSALDAT